MTDTWTKNEGTCPIHPNLMGDDIEIQLRGVYATRTKKPHDVIWEIRGMSGDILEWRFVRS